MPFLPEDPAIPKVQKKFKREIKSLDEIFEFITTYLKKKSVGEAITFTVNLAIEELFTNMVKYSVESTSDIQISLDGDDKQLVVTLVDFDVEPFDLTQSKNVDVKAHLDERKVGGLGLHLVKQMVDKIDYSYENRQSVITFVKKLES